MNHAHRKLQLVKNVRKIKSSTGKNLLECTIKAASLPGQSFLGHGATEVSAYRNAVSHLLLKMRLDPEVAKLALKGPRSNKVPVLDDENTPDPIFDNDYAATRNDELIHAIGLIGGTPNHLSSLKGFFETVLKIQIQTKTRSIGASSKGTLWETTVKTPSLPNVTYIGHGWGANGTNAALKRLLLDLPSRPAFVQDMLLTSGKIKVHSNVGNDDESIYDVCNFALLDDNFPKINILECNNPFKRSLKKKNCIYRATMTIPTLEKDLRSNGFGFDANIALRVAFDEMKSTIERYHADHGLKHLSISDAQHLRHSNAKLFLDFTRYKGITEANREFELKKGRNQLWKGTITMGSTSCEAIASPSKATSEVLAMLALANKLKYEHPAIWVDFISNISKNDGKLLLPLAPIELRMDPRVFDLLTEANLRIALQSRSSPPPADEIPEVLSNNRYSQTEKVWHDEALLNRKSARLKQELLRYNENPDTESIRTAKSSLTMRTYANQLLHLVNENPVSIVIGATGSGKTTQLPQIIFEDAITKGNGAKCNIICTQPRRIAATSVALRVASERGEIIRHSVGYQVRYDSKAPRFNGSINFVTTGVLLRQLHENSAVALEGVSHILIDEVHERDIDIDFLLMLIKRLVRRRQSQPNLPSLRIVLMSATIDTSLFRKYFAEFYPNGDCPYLEVPGRTFPVAQNFLEQFLPALRKLPDSSRLLDKREVENFLHSQMRVEAQDESSSPQNNEEYQIDWSGKSDTESNGLKVDIAEDVSVPIGLIAAAIGHAIISSKDGAVLVFLPGLAEIMALSNLLCTSRLMNIDFQDQSKYKIFLLHSSIPQMQSQVFEPLGEGVRKIILASDIAETSITIPEVQHVVDTGLHRQLIYNPATRTQKLITTWISKSNAKQRSGRAGRVSAGNYYSLLSKHSFMQLAPGIVCEMRRVDLQSVCLRIRAMGITEAVENIFADCIEPPSPSNVKNSVENLVRIEALEADQQIKPFGKLLSELPVEPSFGRMIMLGIMFKCLDPIIVLSAFLQERSPFLSPPGKQLEAKNARLSFVEAIKSDHLTMLNAYRTWRKIKHENGLQSAFRFTVQNFLSHASLINIDKHCSRIMDVIERYHLAKADDKDTKFNNEYGDPENNEYSDNNELILAILATGLYPNLAVQNPGRTLRTKFDRASMIHSRSLLSSIVKRGDTPHHINSRDIVSYGAKAGTDNSDTDMLRDVSPVTQLGSILFSPTSVEKNVLRIDEWIGFYLRNPSASKTISDFNKHMKEVGKLFQATSTVSNSSSISPMCSVEYLLLHLQYQWSSRHFWNSTGRVPFLSRLSLELWS